MPQLGVNIDHVATLRQARKTYEPDPVTAAALAEFGGADAITIHLREDRRHIQDRDLRILRETVHLKLNLELACNDEIVAIACLVKPDQATLVPEKREEVTTEGGLDVLGNMPAVRAATEQLHAAGISVSLFLDPDLRQIEAAAKLSAAAVELHTGQYALAGPAGLPPPIVARLNAEVKKMFGDPQFAQKIVELGQEPAPTTPAGLTAHMRSEATRWTKVIKEAGLKPER